MKTLKVTPILIVDEIESLLPFWERLGFSHPVEVPHGERLGFVILMSEGSQVMLQSRASLVEDLPAVAALNPTCLLYMDVDSIEEALAQSQGLELLVPLRTTFYGAKEFFVRDAQGQILGFAHNEE